MHTSLKKYSLDLILIFLIYALTPLYMLPSGSVQFVDIVIVAMIVITVLNVRVSEFRKAFKHAVPFMPFLVWTVIVNIFYTISSNKLSYILASVELLYTLVIMVCCSIVLKRMIASSENINYMLYIIVGSCLLTMLVPSSTTPFDTRVQLSFNNPNQLAYYALLILTSLVIITDVLIGIYGIRLVHVIMIIAVTAVADTFAYISASRAGLVTSALINVYMLYMFITYNAKRTLFVGAITAGIVLVVFCNVGKWRFLSKSIGDATERFTKVQIIDERNLDNRWFGYLDYKVPYSIVFGDGGLHRPEPAVEREKIIHKEVHNTILWNFLAYGIIGGLLFLAGAAGFYRQLKSPEKFFVLLPLIIFNMTLYGLRFRFFWMTMALLCAASSLHSGREGEKTRSLRALSIAETS
ncbi:MAG: hypothetical protein P4L43_06730 [Syntrophobacteraceae bacterium]|nr:hypothetical protein [Syntrophobacteraceae bacterium]